MADFKIHGMEEMELMLSKLARDAEPTARQALREAAAVVAERVRENIERLGEDRQAQPYPAQQYRYLPEGGRFGGIPPHQKEDLLEGLGITKVGVDNNGDYTVKVGFEGYGSQPTAAYPQGQPIPMIARSIESGSSIQPKQPFFRPAVQSTKKRAVETMGSVIEAAQEKIAKAGG